MNTLEFQAQKTAVWLSRHRYPKSLIHALPGYRLVKVTGRHDSPADALRAVCVAGNGTPAVLFFVLPTPWRLPFVRLAQQQAPGMVLLRTWMTADGYSLYQRVWYDADERRMHSAMWAPQNGVSE